MKDAALAAAVRQAHTGRQKLVVRTYSPILLVRPLPLDVVDAPSST